MALRTLQTAPVPRACVVAAEPPVLAPGPLAARMTVDILGAIPVDELELRSRMLRPGRSVELVEAALSAGGREVARAQAWRVLTRPRGPGSATRSSPTSRPAHCSACSRSPTAATASAASWT